MKLTLTITVTMEHGETRAAITRNGVTKPEQVLTKPLENKLFALTDYLEAERPRRTYVTFKKRLRDVLDIIERDGAVDIATFADECIDGNRHEASSILRRCMRIGHIKQLVSATGHVVRGTYVRGEPRRLALAEGA